MSLKMGEFEQLPLVRVKPLQKHGRAPDSDQESGPKASSKGLHEASVLT